VILKKEKRKNKSNYVRIVREEFCFILFYFFDYI